MDNVRIQLDNDDSSTYYVLLLCNYVIIQDSINYSLLEEAKVSWRGFVRQLRIARDPTVYLGRYVYNNLDGSIQWIHERGNVNPP